MLQFHSALRPDGYLIGKDGVLYITNDCGKTWKPCSLGLENPVILGFGNDWVETPQAAVRFTDAKNGLVVLGLSGNENMIALRTEDGGNPGKKKTYPPKPGKPFISRDGKFLTISKMAGRAYTPQNQLGVPFMITGIMQWLFPCFLSLKKHNTCIHIPCVLHWLFRFILSGIVFIQRLCQMEKSLRFEAVLYAYDLFPDVYIPAIACISPGLK